MIKTKKINDDDDELVIRDDAMTIHYCDYDDAMTIHYYCDAMTILLLLYMMLWLYFKLLWWWYDYTLL